MANLTQASEDSVEDYIASWPGELAQDGATLCGVMEKATGQKPVRWGAKLIGFGTYTYKYASGRTGDWMVVALAPRKSGLTLYLMDGQENYGNRLADMTVKGSGQSCVYLKKLD